MQRKYVVGFVEYEASTIIDATQRKSIKYRAQMSQENLYLLCIIRNLVCQWILDRLPSNSNCKYQDVRVLKISFSYLDAEN